MIKLCEMYPAPQGEGPTMGTPSLFVRLSGCNLHCKWCDSSFTWNFEGTTFRNEAEFSEYIKKVKKEDEMIELTEEKFRNVVREAANEAKVTNIVITGGEPTLQQKQLVEALKPLKDFFTFEVETNGTIMIEDDFFNFIDRINCSPKLANSGNIRQIAFQPNVLKRIESHPKSVFKFVIQSQNDESEILIMLKEAGIPNEKVYLMPEGTTKEEQINGYATAEAIAKRNGWKICPRLHILIHGPKRGV